jgi:hypothetical protein
MKLDSKKIKSLVVTYGSLTLPVAIATFAMNANGQVKILSFLSGLIPVIARQANPKDPFTLNLLAVAKTEIDAAVKKQSKPKA